LNKLQYIATSFGVTSFREVGKVEGGWFLISLKVEDKHAVAI
jgi:hypothetical protein